MLEELIHELEKLQDQKREQSRKVAKPEVRKLIRSELVGVAHATTLVKEFIKQHRLDT